MGRKYHTQVWPQAEAGSGCVTAEGSCAIWFPERVGQIQTPAWPSQAVSPQRAGGGGPGAGLPGSGASDKGLKGLGAPGRCDKAADGRVSCGAPPRLEAPARPPGTGAGDQAGVRGGASGSVTPAFLPSQSR